MADVFISYRNGPERRVIVRRLANILRAYRLEVWWDYGLEAGESFRAQIMAELANARVVAPLWCSESIVSPWVRMEAELGKDKLVPARLQRVVPPGAFEAIHASDLIGWDGMVGNPRLQAFVHKICETLGRPIAPITDMIEEMAHLPIVPPLPEIAPVVVPPTPPAAGSAHDYAFWERQWEKHGAGANPVALRAIAEEAPRYFADQARARSAEIEAEQRYQSEGRIKVDAKIVHGAPDGWFKPGNGRAEWFKDHEHGPEMVVVPSKQPFAVGRFVLTFDEWDSAQAHPDWQKHSGIAPRAAKDYGWGRGRQPAIDVSWEDATAYCKWLSKATAKTYRLPTEVEWEHCCRAGTTTEFWWGNEISTTQANYDGNYTFGNGKKGEYRQRTVPVDSFEANPWGLYQVHGNVWEWCEDAYGESSRVLRGGSWLSIPQDLRSAIRFRLHPDFRIRYFGFRLAGTLIPES